MGFDLKEFLNLNNKQKQQNQPRPASTAMPQRTLPQFNMPMNNLSQPRPVNSFAQPQQQATNNFNPVQGATSFVKGAAQMPIGLAKIGSEIVQTPIDLARLGVANLSGNRLGNNEQIRKSLGNDITHGVGGLFNAIPKTLNTAYYAATDPSQKNLISDNSGLFHAGTYFPTKESYQKLYGGREDNQGRIVDTKTNFGEVLKKSALNAPQLASELLIAKGGISSLKSGIKPPEVPVNVPKVPLTTQLVKNTPVNFSLGATGSAGQQYDQTGKINPFEAAKAGATMAAGGALMEVGGNLAGKGAVAVKNVTTNLVDKSKLLQDQNGFVKVPGEAPQVGKTEGAVPDSNVLKSYAGNDFTQINTHVKGRTLEQMDKRVRDKVEVLDSNMVDDIPAGTYYRGMVLTQSEIDNMVKTGKFKNDGYSSTSTDVQVADRFTQSRRPWIKDEKPVIFQLDVKDGQKGIDLTKISKESARDNEKLLPRNAEYIIKNVSEVDGKYIVDAEYVTTPTPPAPQVGKTDRIKANNGPGKDIIKLPLYNLKKMIYNKDVLTERLRNELEQARKSGQIDEATYQATLIGTKGLESKVGQDVGRAFEKNKQQQQNPVQNQPIVGQDLSGAAQQSHLGKSTNIHDEIPVDRKFTEEQHIQIEKLNDKYVKHFNDLKLNDSQVKDLSRVKGSYYKDVSSYLRDSNAYSDKNKFSLNHLNTDTINKHVAGIDAIFNKPETKIPNDLTVYRGIRSRGIFTKDIVGKTITDNAFMSTSIDPLTARHFSDAQMNNTVKMVLPEGTKAIYTDGLIKPLKTSFGNNFSREHEMLLPRGSSMKILEKKTYNDKYGSHNYYTAEYIPPEQSIQPTKPSLFKNESGAVGMGNNTEPTIHNPFTGKEIPNPNYVKPQNTPIVGPDLNIKQSKFAQGAAKSAEISSELQKQIKESAPTYQGGNNAEQVKTAEAYVKKGYQKATTEVTSTLEKKMGTITPQESANTIAVIKELDKRGGTANLQKATDLTNKLSEHLTAAGQTVQSASLLSNRTPEGLLYGARKFLKSNGVEVTPEIQKQLSDHVNAIRKLSGDARLNEIAKMQNTVEHLVPSSNLDKVIGLWKAGLLTGVKTQTGNTLSGIATNVMKTASDAPAALLDQGFAAFGKTNAGKKLGFTGERSKAFTMRGKASGVIEGGKKGLTALKTGIDERNLEANKFDTKRLVFSNSPAGKAAQKYTDTIYGMMGAADRPNFYANLRNNLYDLAIVDAKNKGLKGPTKEAHIQKFIKEPPMRATEIANKAANTAIFANDTALSRIAGGIIKKAEEAGPGVGAAAKVALPFTKVPSAVATRLIDYSPLGAVKTVAEQIKNVKKGGVLDQRALSEGLAQAGVGTGTMWLGMQLHDNGLMTGSYPTDQKERELWKLEGKQPNSIKVNGKWLSFNYTSPAGQILAVGGKINEAKQKGANLGDQATAGAFAIPKTVSEQSFLQGISGIQDAINDPEKQGAKFFKSQASSVVPTLSSDIAKATDPLQRQSNNVKEAIQAKIPVLNKKLLPKQDAFGAPMPRQSSSTNTLVNPFRPSDVRPTNDLNAELRRLQDQKLGVIPDSTDKQLKFGKTTVNLTPQQLFDKNVFVGQAVKDNWGKIIKTPEYAKMSDSEKQKVLRNVLTDVDALSKADFAAKNNPTLLDETKLTKNQVNLAQGNADYLKTKATTKSTKPKTVKVTKTKSTSKSARSIASNKYNFAKIMTTGIGSSSELRNIVKSSKIVRKKVKR